MYSQTDSPGLGTVCRALFYSGGLDLTNISLLFILFVTTGTRLSLDTIKRRLQAIRYAMGDESRDDPKPPLFKVDVVLAIPNVVMRPNLEDLQHSLNKGVQIILKASQVSGFSFLDISQEVCISLLLFLSKEANVSILIFSWHKIGFPPSPTSDLLDPPPVLLPTIPPRPHTLRPPIPHVFWFWETIYQLFVLLQLFCCCWNYLCAWIYTEGKCACFAVYFARTSLSGSTRCWTSASSKRSVISSMWS